MSALLVGLDVGTSGSKALAIDAESGAVVASATREHRLDTPHPRWAEQDPNELRDAALGALADLARALGARARDVAAIGLTGQMHTAILLDDELCPVRPAMLWCDGRATDACAAITAKLGHEGLRRTVKNLALEGFTVPKLVWLREHEPAALARVRHVLMPKDWVGLALTGELGTDVSDAAGTLAFDPEARAWSGELIAALDLDASWFPPAGESGSRLGALCADAARATGLPEGTPVARGAADNAAGAVGLGVVRDGRAMISLGTSGVVLAHTAQLRVDPAMRLHAFSAAVPGASYLMGVMLSAGGALRWYRDAVAHAPYDAIVADAERAEPGAGGLVFLPYLAGERTPHHDAAARGAFVGLTLRTGQAELARAVLEGISFGLADTWAVLHALEPSVRPDEVRLTGGGARSAFWRQLLADVLDAEVTTTSSTEGPAFGAALLGGVAAGIDASVEAAAERTVEVRERLAPRPALVRRYAEVRAEYVAAYGDLRARFAALGTLG